MRLRVFQSLAQHMSYMSTTGVSDERTNAAEIIDVVRRLCVDWNSGAPVRKVVLPPYMESKLCWSKNDHVNEEVVYDSVNTSWRAFCDEYLDAVHVKRRSPVTGTAGIWRSYTPSGMMQAAQILWQSASCADDLVTVLQTEPIPSADRLLEGLDVMRMMLYVVPTAKAPIHQDFLHNKLDSALGPPAVQAFIQGVEINADDPDVAAAQEALCKFGLLEACLTIVNDERNTINSPSLRLLRAMLDGDSERTAAMFLSQLEKSDRELFTRAMAQLVNKSISGISAVNKAAQNGSPSAYEAALTQAGLIQVGEIIAVVSAACAGNNGRPMQDYIREQPGRRTSGQDGLALIVDYLQALQPFFYSVFHPSKISTPELDEFHNKFVMGHAISCLDACADLIRGPNIANQQRFCDGSIISVISTMISSIDLQRFKRQNANGLESDLEAIGLVDFQKSIIFTMMFRCTEFLADMLEGAPNRVVQLSILESMDWTGYKKMLHELFLTFSLLSKRQLADLTKSERKVHSLSSVLFGIAEQLRTSPVVDDEIAADELKPLLSEPAMCKYYREYCRSVEITREGGELEVVYFPMPLFSVTKERTILKRFEQMMDSCPITDPTEKLTELQEKMLECNTEINHAETAHEWGPTLGSKISAILVRIARQSRNFVGIVTVALNLVLVLSYVPGSCPSCPSTYVSTTAYLLWLGLARENATAFPFRV